MLLKVRSNAFYFRFAHTKTAVKNKSYSYSVLLPQTKLPLRLENKTLIERDAYVNNGSEFNQLYHWQQEHLKEPAFILHDGPPYANGTLHMGHAINKILKDTILRCKIIQGQKVHYVPGWDCHGLPIELKAVSDTKSQLSPIEIRQRARNFAKQTMDKQKQSFKSWGVMGEWENAYTTYSSEYVKNQIRQFFELYQRKLVYRDVKPVYWSPSSRTALAEAELEYNEKHKSTAIIVKLKLNHVPTELGINNSNVYALIWTTTPWTLPSNQAVCFNPNLSYSIVQESQQSDFFVVATNLVDNLSKLLNSTLNIVNTFPGSLLSNANYNHLFNSNIILPFLAADHATETKGTGLVHTAPAHGPDDFLVALKNKIQIISLVNEGGCYTSEAGSVLENLFVLSEGTTAVLDILKRNILHTEEYIHSYPYDWRTKKPIILRASKQWFIDTDAIKNRAIELLGDIKILPQSHNDIYRNSFVMQLKKRPYWCISRQRTWGVPIPVFYEAPNETPVISREIIERLCGLIDKYGTDFWWQLPKTDLLKNVDLSPNNISKSEDILDIWFDSGLSWSKVLGKDLIADLYLEGVDQFTGWFQSSLLTSVALRDKAPYKALYVHGFAVDQHGLKMSKSSGNVIDPIDILQGKKGNKAYGVDTLRWWAVCHANSDSLAHVSKNVLQASSDEVQKIRSVLRFAVGSLFDYKQESMEYSLLIIDKYLLHLTWTYYNQVTEIFDTYDFSRLSALVINLITNPVSALYCVAIKDRLYCNGAENPDRRAAQFVLLQILRVVSRSIAPVVPHLAEELYMHLPQRHKNSFFQDIVTVDSQWNNQKLANVVENTVLCIKKDVHKIFGPNTVRADVTIGVSEELLNDLRSIQSDLQLLSNELVDIFQVSRVNITEDKKLDGDKYSVSVGTTSLHVCERCRRAFSKHKDELCLRCNNVVNSLDNKTAVVN